MKSFTYLHFQLAVLGSFGAAAAASGPVAAVFAARCAAVAVAEDPLGLVDTVLHGEQSLPQQALQH